MERSWSQLSFPTGCVRFRHRRAALELKTSRKSNKKSTNFLSFSILAHLRAPKIKMLGLIWPIRNVEVSKLMKYEFIWIFFSNCYNIYSPFLIFLRTFIEKNAFSGGKLWKVLSFYSRNIGFIISYPKYQIFIIKF